MLCSVWIELVGTCIVPEEDTPTIGVIPLLMMEFSATTISCASEGSGFGRIVLKDGCALCCGCDGGVWFCVRVCVWRGGGGGGGGNVCACVCVSACACECENVWAGVHVRVMRM